MCLKCRIGVGSIYQRTTPLLLWYKRCGRRIFESWKRNGFYFCQKVMPTDLARVSFDESLGKRNADFLNNFFLLFFLLVVEKLKNFLSLISFFLKNSHKDYILDWMKSKIICRFLHSKKNKLHIFWTSTIFHVTISLIWKG